RRRAFPRQQRARYPPGRPARRAPLGRGTDDANRAAGLVGAGPRARPAPERSAVTREPRRKRGLGSILARLFLLGIVVTAVGAWFVHEDYKRFVATELSIGEDELVLEVRRGDSFDHVLRRMRKLGIDEGRDVYWKALAWEQGVIT